jgi:Bacterial SH3 domain
MPRTLVALVVLVAMILLGCAPKPAAPPAVQPQAAAPTAPAAPPAPAPPPSGPATPPPSAPPTTPPPAAAPAAPAPPPARPPAPAAAPAPAAPATAPAKKTVYVKVSQANFREAAGTSGKILRVLRRGSRLEVLETRNDWLRVRLDDGPEGWVAESVTSDTAP